MGYVWSPLAPSPSGIANYVETLIAGDPDFEDVLFVAEDARQRHGRNAVPPEGKVWNADRALLQVGNNRHHGYIMERARMGGAVIELHDLSLHHLHTELTFARNDFPSYLCGLQEAEGEWGRRMAYQRVKGFYTPRLEFYLRANKAICDRAEAIIVHSNWARYQLEMQEVETPIFVIPHFATTPDESFAKSQTKEEARERLKLDQDRFTILIAGYVTPAKRVDWVLDAFELLRRDGTDAQLIVAGACEVDQIADRIEMSPHRDAIRVTGYLDSETFDEYTMAADIIPVMRFPSAGESSGVVARALGFGRLVVVPEYAAFSDLPDDICEKVHLDRPVVDQLLDAFSIYSDSPGRLASVELRAEGYARRNLKLEDQREALKSVLDEHWA